MREVVLAHDADPIKYDFFCFEYFLVSNPITHINVIRGGARGGQLQCDQIWRNVATVTIFLESLSNG